MQTRHLARRDRPLVRTAVAFAALFATSTLDFLSVAQAQAPSVPVTLRRESGNLVLEGVPPRDAAMTERLGRYLNGRNAKFLDWQPDGALLVSTRFGDVDQVHRVVAPAGSREQLTFYSEPISEAAANSNGFAFLKDKGGDENSQIYYYRNADRSTRLLTDGKSLNGSPLWAHDGKRLAFYSNARDGVSYDIYVVDVTANAPPRLISAGKQDTWFPLDWSPDDSKLLLQRYVSVNESYLFVVDVDTGTVTPVADAETDSKKSNGNRKSERRRVDRKNDAKVGIIGAKFAPDGRGIYIVSDEASEFAELFYYDPVTAEKRSVSPEGAQWDVDTFDVSPDGRYIAYVMNEDGRSRLTVIDQQMKLDLAPPGVPEGRITQKSASIAAARSSRSLRSLRSRRVMLTSTTWRRARSNAGRRAKLAPSTAAPSCRQSSFTTRRGSGRRQAAHALRVSLHAEDAGAASGARQHSRRAGGAVPAGLRSVLPVPGERAGLRGNCAERARLIRLRQDVPEARQRHSSRRCGEGHRLAARVGGRAADARSGSHRCDGRLLRRIHEPCHARVLQRSAARWHRCGGDQ